jgi:hypothetical protein
MANVKISELPLGNLTSTSIFPFVDEGTTYQGAISAITTNVGVIQVTYSQLYNRITGGTLNAGNYYLITDYRTCYDQPNYNNLKDPITTGIYKSADTVSPIVVFATSANTISVDAFQPEFPFDKIKYDYSFNATEHTAGPAFGRITERIDNFNNRTDYDHRTILFKRYLGYSYNENSPLVGLVGISGITGTTGILYGNTGTTFNSTLFQGELIAIPNLNPPFFEVISVQSDFRATISGVTISGTDSAPYYYASDDGIMSYYQPNIRQNEVYEYTTFGEALDNSSVINNYIGDQANLYLEDNTGEFLLANNVFLGGSFLNNRIGNGSYNNTFNDDCDSNQIGDRFYNNSTNDDFDGNIIGDFFNNNYITANFNNNRIGSDFDFNLLIGGSFYRNNIGNDFANNVWTNGDFQNNEIGNQFNNNNIYAQFYNNDIGNGYNNNESYSDYYRNIIGNGYNNNTVYSDFYENNIGHVFVDNNIGTNLTIGTYGFYRNMIGSGFNNNEIRNNLYRNEIGHAFNNNSISATFNNNNILNNFYENTIYSVFEKNKIMNDFNTCTIGNSGDIGDNNFVSNEIMNNFKGNNIRKGFQNNTIKTDFKGNETFADFDNNNVAFGCAVNVFSGDVTNNTFGDFFTLNTCEGQFRYNTIGIGFNSNDIGDSFGVGGGNYRGNRIGNNFSNNNIGEYFYSNTIEENFENNTIGYYFQSNDVKVNYLNNIDFTALQGNVLTISNTTPSSSGNGVYNVVQTSTTGHGNGLALQVTVSGGVVTSVVVMTAGTEYLVSDQITVSAVQFEGLGDLVITVSSVSDEPLVYTTANCTIQKTRDEFNVITTLDWDTTSWYISNVINGPYN